MKYRVQFIQMVSCSIEVDVAEGDVEGAELAAQNKAPWSLCHQCAGEFDLAGDWELNEVVDMEGVVLWQQPED